MAGTSAPAVGQKYSDQPSRKLMGHLAKIFQNTRTGRAFDLEIITVKKMVAFKGLKNQVVDWKPDRTSPIGITAEQIGITLARYIIDAIFLAVGAEDVRSGRVNFRNGANSARRKKFIFVQKILQDPSQSLLRWYS